MTRTWDQIRHLEEREHAVPCTRPGCRGRSWRNDALCEVHAPGTEERWYALYDGWVD